MKKVKIKLTHAALDMLLTIIHDQVITERKPVTNYEKLVIAALTEFYVKHFQKTCFAYIGDRTISLTVAQACALMEVIQEGWFSTPNQWTHTVLQTSFERIHKQLL